MVQLLPLPKVAFNPSLSGLIDSQCSLWTDPTQEAYYGLYLEMLKHGYRIMFYCEQVTENGIDMDYIICEESSL